MKLLFYNLAILTSSFTLANTSTTQKVFEINLQKFNTNILDSQAFSDLQNKRFLEQQTNTDSIYDSDEETIKRTGRTYEKDLMNYYNVQYYGKMYIGTQKSEVTVIFDTGSSWLWVPTTDCKDCHSMAKLYDTKQSSSFQKLGNVPQHIQYGGGSVWGYKSKDLVCLDQTSQNLCIEDLPLLSVFITSELSGLQCDGILGLAPSSQASGAELFIDKLYQSGIIDNRMFSFSFGGSDEQSKIIFGGYDLKYARENQTITWNTLQNTQYWTVKLSQVKIGNYTFKLDTSQAIIDSGTSYILLPQNDFNEFRKFIESGGRKCSFDYGQTNLYTCQCLTDSYSDFPDFEIKLAGNTYSIPSTSYMQKQNFKCYFRVVAQAFNGQSFWILGDTFMINYYTIFDLENKRVGLAGSVHVEHISYWRDIILVVSILMAFAGFSSLLLSCFRERKVCPVMKESEMIENPRGKYESVKIESIQENQDNTKTHGLQYKE